jgi:hypothetical protein
LSDIALAPRAPAPVFSRPWIFGPRTDYVVSLGGMTAGFALFFLYAVLGWPVVLVWFVWVLAVDTPHLFASYFRTYLDKEERTHGRRLLIGTLAVFLVAPTVLLVSYALYGAGFGNPKLPWTMFLNVVSVWAYYHVVRQHYGILRLYNRKGGEFGTREAKLDALTLYGTTGLAYLGLVMQLPEGRQRLGLGPWMPIDAGIWTSPVSTIANLSPDQMVFFATVTGVVILTAHYVLFQVQKLARGEPVNLPKVVFLASVIALHGFMAFSGHLPGTTVIAFTAVTTIYHDVQYFFVVWFYSKNRYGKSAAPWRDYGLAGALSKSFPLVLLAGILALSLPMWGFGCAINRVAACASGPALGTMTFLGETTWVLVFIWLSSGFQMHHYVLDQFIWRPSRSAQLRKQLKLEA